MKKFFYLDENNNQYGPFSKEVLASKGITPTTDIWTEGLADWTQAQFVPQLADLFQSIENQTDSEINYKYSVADSENNNYFGGQNNTPPRNYIGRCVLAVFIGFVPLAIVAMVNAIMSQSIYRNDYQKALACAENAKKYSKISIIIGLVLLPFIFYYYYSTLSGL